MRKLVQSLEQGLQVTHEVKREAAEEDHCGVGVRGVNVERDLQVVNQVKAHSK